MCASRWDPLARRAVRQWVTNVATTADNLIAAWQSVKKRRCDTSTIGDHPCWDAIYVDVLNAAPQRPKPSTVNSNDFAMLARSVTVTHPSLDLIDQFFTAYGNHDRASLRNVLAENATWTFPGNHPLSGTKVGIDEVIAFFDAMGTTMRRSNANVEKRVTGVNEQYVVECQHIRTSRTDGPNLDQEVCVLWRIEHGKIASGKHLAADQHRLDVFFTTVLG